MDNLGSINSLPVFVLVCSVSPKKIIPQTWWLKKREIYLLPVLEAGIPGSRCWQFGVFLRSLSLSCTWPLPPVLEMEDGCVFTCPFPCGCTSLLSLPLLKTLLIVGWESFICLNSCLCFLFCEIPENILSTLFCCLSFSYLFLIILCV